MKTTENPARRLFRLRKLPARYAGLVMPLFLSIFISPGLIPRRLRRSLD